MAPRPTPKLITGLAILVALGLWLASRWPSSERSGPLPRSADPDTRGSAKPRGALAAKNAPTDRWVRGTVTSIAGPVQGAVVKASRATHLEVKASCESEGSSRPDPMTLIAMLEEAEASSEVVAEATSDQEGHFTLELSEPGPLELTAEHPELGIGSLTPVASGTGGARLFVQPGATLVGETTDEGLRPLSGVHIALVQCVEGRAFRGISGPKGRFELGQVPPGPAWLLAWDDDHLPAMREADPGRDNDLRLRRARDLTGSVRRGPEGVPGVIVRVQGPRQSYEATSGADGQFSFSGLAADHHRVVAESGDEAADVVVDLSEPGSAPVELQLGSAGSIEGVVRDPKGAPIAGVEVTITVAHSLTRHSTTAAHSDEDGRYRIVAAPQVYSIEVAKLGFTPSGLDDRKIIVTRGQVTRVDRTLSPVGVISGQVVAEDGTPLPGVKMRRRFADDGGATAAWLKKAKAEGVPITFDRSADFVLQWFPEPVDSDGRFAFGIYLGAQMELAVTHPEHRTATVRVTSPSEGLKIVLEPGLGILGTVFGPDGHPMAGAIVTVTPDGAGLDSDSPPAITPSSGRFSFGGLADGRYLVKALGPDQESWWQTEAAVTIAGNGTTEVELRFQRGQAISGQVVDQAGRPVFERVRAVRASAPDGEPETYPQPKAELLTAFTDPEGRFILRPSSDGEYRIWIPAHAQRPEAQTIARAGASDVSLVVPAKTELRGRVLGPTGEPLRAFTVDKRTVFHDQGTFKVILEQGPSHVHVTADGYATTSVPLPEPLPNELDLGDITLTRGREMSGRVLDGVTKGPIVGAQIHVGPFERPGDFVARSESRPPTTISDADGNFRVAYVPDGDSLIRIAHRAYAPLLTTLRGPDREATFELLRTGTVVGRLVDKPPTVRVIAAKDPATGIVKGLAFFRGNTFKMDAAPGTWRLETVPTLPLRQSTVTVRSGAEVRLDLELAGPAAHNDAAK